MVDTTVLIVSFLCGKDMTKREETFIKKFNDKYGKCFEYIGGYSTDCRNRIIIRCKKCGSVRRRTRHKIFENKSNIACPECGNNKRGISIGICVECGKEYVKYSPQQILCAECHDKRTKERWKINKRLRESKAKSNGEVDYSITLTKLIERDKGVCQLCGRKVDETDYVYVNDNFIAGNNYPSIDHIVPLSKGGVHQWDNVQLAHRICNSIKHNKA